MPVGVFQPSAPGAAAARTDLDLWQCVVREYAEEFLGLPDEYGAERVPEDRAARPLRQALDAARRARRVRVSYLGIGVDPLSFATDLLAVCVLDSDVFDEVFGHIVSANEEGTVLGATGSGARGLRFDAATVRRVTEHEPMQAAGAAVLAAAWRHRDLLLAR
jgi:hypothetical protein